MKRLIFALSLAACGGSQTPTTPSSQPVASAPVEATPAAVDCDDVCTTYAVCSEEVEGGDFRGGGQCVSACEEMAEADRRSWAKKIEDASAAKDCKRLFADEE